MPGGFVGSGPYSALDRNAATIINRIGAAHILEKGRYESLPLRPVGTDPPKRTEYTLLMSSIMDHLMHRHRYYCSAQLVDQATEGRPDTPQDVQAARWMEAVTTIRFTEFYIETPHLFWLLATMLQRYCPNVSIVVIKRSDDVVPTLLQFLSRVNYKLAHLDVAFDVTSFDRETLLKQRRLGHHSSPSTAAYTSHPNVTFCPVQAAQLTVHTHGAFRFNVDYMLGFVWSTVRSMQVVVTHHALPDYVTPAKMRELLAIAPDEWFFCDPKPLRDGYLCEKMQHLLELTSKPWYFLYPPPQQVVWGKKRQKLFAPPNCKQPDVNIRLPWLESLYVVNAEAVPLWKIFRKGDLSADVLNALPKVQYVGVCCGGVWLEPLPTHRELHMKLQDVTTDTFAGQILLDLANRPKVDDDTIPTYGTRSQRYVTRHMYGGDASTWVETVSRPLHQHETIRSEDVVLFIWYRRCRATLVVTRQRTAWSKFYAAEAAKAAKVAKHVQRREGRRCHSQRES